MNASKSVYIPPAELVDERTQEARFGLAELAHQVVAAAGAVDGLARLGEDSLNLFVQFVPIGDDGHARVGVVLQDPPSQQYHDDALATALGVPDDAALATLDMLLRGFDAEILVHARQLLHAAVEQHKVVHQLDQPILAAHLEQVLVQLEAAVVRLVLLPRQEILLLCPDGTVAQSLGVIAGADELHGAKEPFVELGPLVGDALADAVANRSRSCVSVPAPPRRCRSHRAQCQAAARGCRAG